MAAKVLVVEDHDDVREMMKIVLAAYGCEVAEASNGREAIETAQKFGPDLILMDIAMPVMDGLTATRALRQHERLSSVPIIGVTAFDEVHGDKARAAGFDNVIPKPVDFGRLEKVIINYLEPASV
ncbi:MAG: response regulator [Pyrinomonadaceae bacterium]